MDWTDMGIKSWQ